MKLAAATVGCLSLLLVGCPPPKKDASPPPTTKKGAAPLGQIMPGEIHFADMKQITYGGENAEAYWSYDGTQLVFQARPTGEGCDQIFKMKVDDPQSIARVSSGKGVTTCSYFMPGDQEIIYASTHLGGDACPPKPDRSQGYVWPLYDTYDIFKVNVAGGEPVALTSQPGYDAEATVCPKDGSIIFTSTRDGDLELYRMDADGGNVKRLTNTKGYDGGAFFNADCSKIVWRASRPTGEKLADYERLLAQGLVRPTKLELYVANADGSHPRQVTYLNSASFAPYWFPNRDRLLFSTNYGDPKGREFEMWAIDVDGTDLERITYSPGFDGFPMFSPDGRKLAFASNRATAEGEHDTNVFVIDWQDSEASGGKKLTAADRVYADIAWLADPQREGRGIQTKGLAVAGAWIEEQLRAYMTVSRQSMSVPISVKEKEGTRLVIDGAALERKAFQTLTGSASAKAKGDVVFAGWGTEADYKNVDAKGKIALVRRFVADDVKDASEKRRLSSLRYKAWAAKQNGAMALLVVDAPLDDKTDEAAFPGLRIQGYGDAGLPMMIVKRDVGAPLIDKLGKKRRVRAELETTLKKGTAQAFNVVGKLAANTPNTDKLAGAVIVGAHYDHLGMGGHGSLAPDSKDAHLGADDNASGVAALLEVSRALAAMPDRRRDVWFVAFTAEEVGVLGSNYFVDNPPPGLDMKAVRAMLNMDMVGRLRRNKLSAIGGGTATEWPSIVGEACAAARVSCDTSGDGYGPSDQTPFYAAGIPVLHFFTGAHSDYHKPSDTLATVNAIGAAKVAEIVAAVAGRVMSRPSKLSFQRIANPPPAGDMRSFGASLGSIPDYAGPPNGQKGVLLEGVRPGGAADLAGMKRGDILTKLSSFTINNVHDLMYALRASKPGQTIKAQVLRDGKTRELDVTFQKSKRRRH